MRVANSQNYGQNQCISSADQQKCQNLLILTVRKAKHNSRNKKNEIRKGKSKDRLNIRKQKYKPLVRESFAFPTLLSIIFALGTKPNLRLTYVTSFPYINKQDNGVQGKKKKEGHHFQGNKRPY